MWNIHPILYTNPRESDKHTFRHVCSREIHKWNEYRSPTSFAYDYYLSDMSKWYLQCINEGVTFQGPLLT